VSSSFGVRFYMRIQDPIPPNIGFSYGDFGYANFGACVWEYEEKKFFNDETFQGAVEWINFRNFVTEPKYVNPLGLRFWLKPGITAIYRLMPAPLPDIPVEQINGIVTSMITGANMPFRVP